MLIKRAPKTNIDFALIHLLKVSHTLLKTCCKQHLTNTRYGSNMVSRKTFPH